jgi:hypothetical protein
VNERIFRVGRLVESEHAGRALIELSHPCQTCSSTCLSRHASTDWLLEVSDTGDFSGKIGKQVAISVSRPGLTRASVYAFGPALLVLTGIAVGTEIAESAETAWLIEPAASAAVGLASVVLSALGLAVYLSRALLQGSASRLLDVQTELQTPPGRDRAEPRREGGSG